MEGRSPSRSRSSEHQLNFLQSMISPANNLYDSPTKYDIDFYQKKINRFENDLNNTIDELNQAKVRLRRAEDFEIKFDILLKQKDKIQTENKSIEKSFLISKQNNQELQLRIEEACRKLQKLQNEKGLLIKQKEQYRIKLQQLEQITEQNKKHNINEMEKRIKQETDEVKRNYIQKEESYKFQIRQLGQNLHQKQTIQKTINERVISVKGQKDQDLKKLQIIIHNLKEAHLITIAQKNAEIDEIRNKFQNILNTYVQNIQGNMSNQSQIFQKQLEMLKKTIQLKNQQNLKIIEDLKINNKKYHKQRTELNLEITLLKQKFYTLTTQYNDELVNLKQRITKLHAIDIKGIQVRHQDVVNTLQTDHRQLQKRLKQKQQIINYEKNEMIRKLNEQRKIIAQKQIIIKDLKNKLKNEGDTNSKQINNLHQSFQKLETDKELISSQYQSHVTFLNQQIVTLTNNGELKNIEIQQLFDEICRLKKNNAEQIKELQKKWKQQRKQKEMEREKQRNTRQNIEEQYQQSSLEWKTKQRQLQREKQKEQRQKNKIIYENQELQRDIQRLNLYLKSLEETCKIQIRKNQENSIGNGGMHRELLNQYDRQKSQAEAIKLMEIDQIRKKSQIDINKLRNQNEKLKNELQAKIHDFDIIEKDYHKLQTANKNVDKIQRDKLIQYQKKMTSLNNEINLTQNLYHNFIDAKSRVVKKTK